MSGADVLQTQQNLQKFDLEKARKLLYKHQVNILNGMETQLTLELFS